MFASRTLTERKSLVAPDEDIGKYEMTDNSRPICTFCYQQWFSKNSEYDVFCATS